MTQQMTIHYCAEADREDLYPLLFLADPSEAQIERYAKTGHCYYGQVGNRMIGVYVLMETEKEILELKNIAVAFQFRQQGYGKALLMDAIEKAKEHGAKMLEVCTGNSSIDQLVFYQKCGFRMKAIERDYFTKHYEEPIYENGIQCIDQVRLSLEL